LARLKLGLVLSGGGASGAYEVGVIRAMAKLKLNPQVVSGASIGALNGAVVASTPRISLAAKNLEVLWCSLRPEMVLKPRQHRRLKRLQAEDRSFLDAAKSALDTTREQISDSDSQFFALLDESPIDKILGGAIDFKRLRKGRELHISVYPCYNNPGWFGALNDLFHWIIADRSSEYIKAQDYSSEQIMTLLKASAAIPLAFQAQEFNGRLYRDGGLGAKGNTPVEPILQAGCTHGIVVILDPSDSIDPADWPGMNLIQLQPSKSLHNENLLQSLLDFSPERIEDLIQLGEEDTLNHPGILELKRTFDPMRRFLSTFRIERH
jgi:NTE family protein